LRWSLPSESELTNVRPFRVLATIRIVLGSKLSRMQRHPAKEIDPERYKAL
jgi:hypothetical protein